MLFFVQCAVVICLVGLYKQTLRVCVQFFGSCDVVI